MRGPIPWLLLLFTAIATVLQVDTALSFGHGSWQLSEWLINFQGGFVRRGLPGEFFRMLSIGSGIAANHLVIAFSFCAYLLFAPLFFQAARRHFSAAFLLSCFVLGFPACQDSIVRKDCFLLLLLMASIRLVVSPVRSPLHLVLLMVVSALAMLCHEAYVFFALPCFLLYTRTAGAGDPIRLVSGFRWSAAAVLLGGVGLAAWNHGTPVTAAAVNESWLELWRKTDPGSLVVTEPAAAIQALGWTTAEGLSPSWNLLTSGIYQPAAWLFLFTLAFVLVLGHALTPGGDERDRSRLAGILLVQLVSISPLFLLGFDYGRWLFFWLTSSILIHSAGLNPPRVALVAGGFVVTRVGLRRAVATAGRNAWVLLLVGVPVCWNLQEFLSAGPLGRLLRMVRENL